MFPEKDAASTATFTVKLKCVGIAIGNIGRLTGIAFKYTYDLKGQISVEYHHKLGISNTS
jgi:hypothetical protein